MKSIVMYFFSHTQKCIPLFPYVPNFQYISICIGTNCKRLFHEILNNFYNHREKPPINYDNFVNKSIKNLTLVILL